MTDLEIRKYFKEEPDKVYQLQLGIDLLAKRLNEFKRWAEVEKFLEKYFYYLPFKAAHARIVREWYEVATLRRALLRNVGFDYEEYCNLVDLYEQQLKLRRTSHNQIMEQFSTPLPVAFLLGKWATHYIDVVDYRRKIRIVDPTAGNGLLMYYAYILSGVNLTIKLFLNEIDPLRYFNLNLLFGWDKNRFSVENKDFFDYTKDTKKKSDVLLINPPFSRSLQAVSFLGKDGQTYKFKVQSFAFTFRALNTLLKDNGRAACIIHGSAFDIDRTRFWDEKGRPKQGEERNFWFYLYRHYNVVDVIYIDGKRLWAKQGQETNLRIILIDGRRKEAHNDIFPPLYTDWVKVIDNWCDLRKRIYSTIVPLKELTVKYLKNG